MKALTISVVVGSAMFLLSILLTGLAAMPDAPSALTAVLPEVEVAEAFIRRQIISPDIESTLQLSLNGRHVSVEGRVACDEGEQVRLDVTVTQASSGAVGTGHTRAFCTGAAQDWIALAVAKGATKFAAGAAEACAVAETRLKGKTTDTHSWCADVTLVTP
jgi:hypothetical protein